MTTTPITLISGQNSIVDGSTYNGSTISTSYSYIVYANNYGDSINFKASTAFNSLYGGSGNDSIVGSSSVGNNLYSGGGNDTLIGGSGDDNLVVNGAGNCLLKDGNGSDNIYVLSAGNDTITVGTGNDLLYVGGASNVTITALGQAVGTYSVGSASYVNADSLFVATGSTANATIVAAWTATAISQNNGTANLITNGYNVNLASAGGTSGWNIVDNGSQSVLTANNAGDTLVGGSLDTLIGGSGADTFMVKSGVETITNLGNGADILIVSAGATANVTLANAWTATMATQDSGTVNLVTNGYNVNIANANSIKSWVITDNGGASLLVGNNYGDIFNGSNHDTLTGGVGVDTFNIRSGSEVITNLSSGGGADILDISSGATVAATLAAAWTATSLSANSGSAVLVTNGYNVNIANAGGSGSWSITDTGHNAVLTANGAGDTLIGGSSDTLVGGVGNDTFVVTTGAQTITNFGKGTDVLNVSVGATANITLAAAWTATAAIQDSGTVNLVTNSYNVNIANANSSVGWHITDNGTNAVLVGNNSGDVFSGGSGDTLTGGTAADTFNIRSGREVVTNLGSGADILSVNSGATVSATVVAAWTATSSTVNNGTAFLVTNGSNVNIASVGGVDGWTITDIGSNAVLTGNSNADTLVGGNGDTLIGGTGNDTFVVNIGSETITNLGGAVDVLNVGIGATVHATATAAWTATSATTDSGSAFIVTNGYNVNIANAGGIKGWTITDAGHNAVLTANAVGDTLIGGSADTLVGGLGNDTFIVGFGVETITNLGKGIDVLEVSSGATANATLAASWTATASTTNSGLVNITDNGYNINLSAVTTDTGGFNIKDSSSVGISLIGSSVGNDTLAAGSGSDTLTASNVGHDTLVAGTGTDVLIGSSNVSVVDKFIFASGEGGLTASTLEQIKNWSAADLITDTSTTLKEISASNATVSISGSTGVATFASGQGTTLASAVTDLTALLNPGAGNAAGDFAIFQVNRVGAEYVLISDGSATGVHDTLIELVGVTVGTAHLASGVLSIHV